MDQDPTIMPLEFVPARQVLAREDAGTRQLVSAVPRPTSPFPLAAAA
jgi:hypothetical protein